MQSWSEGIWKRPLSKGETSELRVAEGMATEVLGGVEDCRVGWTAELREEQLLQGKE